MPAQAVLLFSQEEQPYQTGLPSRSLKAWAFHASLPLSSAVQSAHSTGH